MSESSWARIGEGTRATRKSIRAATPAGPGQDLKMFTTIPPCATGIAFPVFPFGSCVPGGCPWGMPALKRCSLQNMPIHKGRQMVFACRNRPGSCLRTGGRHICKVHGFRLQKKLQLHVYFFIAGQFLSRIWKKSSEIRSDGRCSLLQQGRKLQGVACNSTTCNALSS